ncbi:MAG: hypothetical protein FJ013_02400, partial [Chloroflexi bacterium]|nr:hypothetical protein [Chloroflexota bacterium]
GSPLEPNARFCPNCGSQAGGAPQQQAGWGQPQQPQQQAWGQPQQQAWGQQPQQQAWGQPQQPGWGQQQAWGQPVQSGPSRGLLLVLLFILLIGLGGFIYWQFGSRMGNILAFLRTSGGGGKVVDITAPTFSNIKASAMGTIAVISWNTNEPASSQVEYGASTSYGSREPAVPKNDPTTGQSAGIVTHSVELTGLQTGSTYHFRVRSKDKAGNEAVSNDNTFTVQPIPEEEE